MTEETEFSSVIIPAGLMRFFPGKTPEKLNLRQQDGLPFATGLALGVTAVKATL